MEIENMDAKLRESKITQTSIVGIGANVALVTLKAIVGMLAGSIAIILDAVNNLTDALSSIITIVGVKLAHKKPDKEHPYGHGRIEYLSAIVIAVIILVAGATSLVESVQKIIEPVVPDFSIYTIIVVVLAVIIKFFLGKFVKKQGKKYNSDALVASGADASFDALISVSTLVGIAVTMIFNISVDGYLGVAISIFIIKAGIEVMMESVGSLIGNRFDSESSKAIKADVRSVEGVLGAYDLILHNYGPDSSIGSVHIEVPDTLSAGEVHKIIKNVQKVISDKYHVFLTVGLYAVNSKHAEDRKKINDFAKQHSGVINTHGVFFDDDEKYVSFDTGIDFTVTDIEKLNQELSAEVKTILPGYDVRINFDEYYSD